METDRITSIEDVENFLQGAEKVDFSFTRKKEKYQFISDALVKLKYHITAKRNKILIKRYLEKVTNYSKEQLKRLIRKWGHTQSYWTNCITWQF